MNEFVLVKQRNKCSRWMSLFSLGNEVSARGEWVCLLGNELSARGERVCSLGSEPSTWAKESCSLGNYLSAGVNHVR